MASGPEASEQAAGELLRSLLLPLCPKPCPSEGVLILLLTLLGAHGLRHFPPGLSEDSLLLSLKRAYLSGSFSAVPKAETLAACFPSHLLWPAFGRGSTLFPSGSHEVSSSPQGPSGLPASPLQAPEHQPPLSNHTA